MLMIELAVQLYEPRMAEDFLDHTGGHALGEQDARRPLSMVVQSNLPQPLNCLGKPPCLAGRVRPHLGMTQRGRLDRCPGSVWTNCRRVTALSVRKL